MTPTFFESLGNQDMQQTVLQHLIDALVHTKNVHVAALIKNSVKKVGRAVCTVNIILSSLFYFRGHSSSYPQK